jgi:hypothetical protein
MSNGVQIDDLKPLIVKLMELRTYKERRETALKEELKDCTGAITDIKAYLQAAFVQNGIKNMSVAGGTGYLKRVVSYRVSDLGRFVEWLKRTDNWELIDVSVLGKQMDEYVSTRYEDWKEQEDKHGVQRVFSDFIPPGLSREYALSFVIRKSSEG